MSLDGEKRERWIQLAAHIAAEQDPKKLHALIAELAEALEDKDHQAISLIKSNRSDENRNVERGSGTEPGGLSNVPQE